MLVLSICVTGCTTDYLQDFHGQVRNLKFDQRTETVECKIPGYCSGSSVAGGQFIGFDLPAQGFSIYLFYPKVEPKQCLSTRTAPPLVDAWLIRTNRFYDCGQLARSGDQALLREAGGQKLGGTIAVQWRSEADFNFTVDLTADVGDSTAVQGKFRGYVRERFDPATLFVGLGLPIFREGTTTPRVQPVISIK